MIRLPFRDGFYEVKPSKIICLGRNYAEHARELGHEIPKEPVIFLKPPSALIGPEETIILPRKSQRVDHEVELAVIIGKKGKNIPRAKAMDHVLGYTILMDLTARDIQWEAKEKGLPWTVAKGFDTFAPIGPRVVDKRELDINDLEIGLKVNGEVKQLSRTSKMIFKIDEIIEYVSSIMTLEKGDVIATGTPEGVGPLRHGDFVEAWIEGIGILKEEVLAEHSILC
ncbi:MULTISPECIES: fumarylacetoacetate hydrolase family protein [Thermococcus]|uniref:2-hydroxyhepta-2,4-diene-1,7-dioate isomerase, FAA hydrolase family n=1 Tax=Thermococcus sibiricus TaxID=172049 RepID=A0A117L0Z7_9EURY|nr:MULTISPECIES: fumarylacetoacetate hydrolase family protein [Thermococcus]KUK17020.1 MAG: 2-hydroxyhepta-2,4-diene-1,7-dioate isomerase, FAA hydrolase family [Thermococcus sibiricus]KUK28736.1 MAG: 2-hydroxyhepta-2,4-diene-1,7-dioate isomerase, FAA hydrolase family [Thermococcus sp. 40_45]MBC7093976.1 fumarylacetoacetate hydrolase family protein [Thermococcus sp.]HII67804.1 fumarylacetoacetate hydrolase family protein [Thermococcaceae archaeon]